MKKARYPLPMELRYMALGLRERGKLAQAMALEKQAQRAEANPSAEQRRRLEDVKNMRDGPRVGIVHRRAGKKGSPSKIAEDVRRVRSNPGSIPLSRLFAALKKKAAEKLPWIAKVRLSRCAMAETENKESARQVMHTGHKPLCVCFAKVSETFSTPIKVGLLVHELGHFAAGGGDVSRPHSEPAANKYGRALTGIGVSYVGPLRLQRSKIPAWLADAVRK